MRLPEKSILASSDDAEHGCGRDECRNASRKSATAKLRQSIYMFLSSCYCRNGSLPEPYKNRRLSVSLQQCTRREMTSYCSRCAVPHRPGRIQSESSRGPARDRSRARDSRGAATKCSCYGADGAMHKPSSLNLGRHFIPLWRPNAAIEYRNHPLNLECARIVQNMNAHGSIP